MLAFDTDSESNTQFMSEIFVVWKLCSKDRREAFNF